MHFKLTTGGCGTLARFVCAAIILVCDSAVSLAQEPSQSGSYTATMEEICRHDEARQLVATMMAETLEIAEAVGAHPQISIQKRLRGAEKVGAHKTSTLQDLSSVTRP